MTLKQGSDSTESQLDVGKAGLPPLVGISNFEELGLTYSSGVLAPDVIRS